MFDTGNNALHFPEPDGSMANLLTPELIKAGFATPFLDDHFITLYHQGDMVAPFTLHTSPEYVQAEAYAHLKTHGAEFRELLHEAKNR